MNLAKLRTRIEADARPFDKAMEHVDRLTDRTFGRIRERIRRFRQSFDKELKKGLAIGAGAMVAAKGMELVGRGIQAVADYLGDSIEAAIEFERAMLNVSSISGETGQALERTGDAVLGLSVRFGQGAATMAKGLYDISSSGFQGAAALEVLEASALAATAGLSTTEEAAAGITAVLNAYGMSASQASRVSDVLFQTVNRGVVTFPELSAEIGKTTALASPLGVSLEEVAAGIAVMTRHGIDAANATTQLNAIMSSMLQPSAEATELAQRLGIEWNAAGLRARGLIGQLTKLIKVTGGNEATMAVLLGDVRAVRGAFALMARDGAELTDELRIMNETVGATQRAFETMAQSDAFKLAQAEAQLAATQIRVGELFTDQRLMIEQWKIDFIEGIAVVGAALQGMTLDQLMAKRAMEEQAFAAAAMRQQMRDLANFPGKVADDFATASARMASGLPEAVEASGWHAKAKLGQRIDGLIGLLHARRDALVSAATGVADATWDPQINKAELALVGIALKSDDLAARLASNDKAIRLAAEVEQANLRKDQARLRALVQADQLQGQRELEAALLVRNRAVSNAHHTMLADSGALAKATSEQLAEQFLLRQEATFRAAKVLGERAAAGIRAGFGSVNLNARIHAANTGPLEFDKKAGGGWSQINTPTLVGEKGPEWVDFGKRMFVHDADKTAGAGGGGDTHITINNPEPRAADDDIGRMLRRLGGLGITSTRTGWSPS